MTVRARSAVSCVAALLGAFVVSALVMVVAGDGFRVEIVLGRGVLFGGFNALLAAGLVFVHRAARVVNFSQAGFGALAVFAYLNLREAWEWSFAPALALALLGSMAVGALVELVLLRRFALAPRLVVTVVTIAVGQTLLGLALAMPGWFGFLPDPDTGQTLLPAVAPATPFDRLGFGWGRLTFTGAQVLAFALTVVALLAFATFLRFTRVGTALRAASENRERAGQLGIDVGALSTVVWVVVALLGAVAAVGSTFAGAGSLQSTVQSSVAAFGVGTLLRGLAPAVLARFDDLPLAICCGFAVGMVEDAVRTSTGQPATVDLLLFVVIIAALLVQRRGESRVAADDVSSWAATEEVRAIPDQLARLPSVVRGLRRARWLVIFVVVLFPWVMSPSQVSTGALYAIYGIVGISLVVLTGWAGQISLGQFAFVAVGAVFGGFLGDHGWPFLLVLPLVSTLTAGVAVLVGLPALRIRGLFLAVSTLAFAVACSTFLLDRRFTGALLVESLDRPQIFWIDTGAGERVYYYVCVAVLGFALFAATGLRRSRTGRLLIATRENERTAQSFTINLVRMRLSAFAFSGFLAGMAGVLFVFHQNGISPASYDATRSVDMFLLSVLGGLGSVVTVLVGAIYFATAALVVGGVGGRLLAGSTGVLVILVFLPTGLGSLIFRARDGWLRRVATRNRIFVPTLAAGRLKVGDEAKIPIADRPDDAAGVENRYELLGSAIGDQGSSQYTKVWRY
ncbi:MAG TPA: ABC transporter permease [Acidimicrobiales bacterium]|nr:ABC transporter permease [Acidimicrobiales bacterium]